MSERTSGVYAIVHCPSGRVYVGSSKDVFRRWQVHRSSLNHGRHHSPALLDLWLLDGLGAFTFVVLESCVPDVLAERAQDWFGVFPDKLNKSPHTANPSFDSRVVEKIRVALRAHTRSPQHQANISAAVAEANRRRVGTTWCAKDPEAWKRRISLTKRRTYTWKPHVVKDPAAWKTRLGAVRLGRHFGPHTAEHRAKIGDALKAAYGQGRRVPLVRNEDGRFAKISRA